MKAEELVELGFEKVTFVYNGEETHYMYRYYVDEDWSLLTQDSDEVINGEFFVFPFENTDKFKFVELDHLKGFLELLKESKK